MSLDDFARQVDAVVEEHRRRLDTAHERVACPTCSAPVGQRCKSMPRGFRPLDLEDRVRTLKTPHRARLRADGTYER